MRRKLRKAASLLLAAIVLLAGIGMLYQWNGANRDRRAMEPAGQLYDIGGERMHLYVGGRGDATVVFASGWGTPSPYADFSTLYSGLEPHVRVAVYDRFGYGFSDVTGRKKDVDAVTDEIHSLLAAAGLKPPFVFVGHSLGSLETLRYAQRFPDEVKGIVLVEGGSPEYYEEKGGYPIISYSYRMLRTFGVLRLLEHSKGFDEWVNDENNGQRLLSEEMRELARRATRLKSGNRDQTDEQRRVRANAETVLAGGKPLRIPMTVLTADGFGKLNEDPDWRDSQAELPSWSTEGKQIIVPDSNHYIHAYRPDIVVREILALVAETSQTS